MDGCQEVPMPKNRHKKQDKDLIIRCILKSIYYSKNMKKNFFTPLFCLIVSITLGTLFSCNREDFNDFPNTNGTVNSHGYMKINFNLSDYKAPTTSGTRAMTEDDEIAIKPEQLSLLVFKGDGDFYYKAPIVEGSLQIEADKNTPSKATGTVTVKLVKSDTETFDLVLVANHDISGITMKEGETTKAEVLKALTYDLPTGGKWNAGGGDKSTPFPMWAELKNVEVKENMTNPEVDLYRALARIDVGASFDFTGGTNTEKTVPLADFKIKSVNVYRTYNQGQVAPLSSDKKPGEDGYTASIPEGAARFADDEPLVYTIADAEGADKYVREIYVPEADLPATPSNDNMHTLVVGGFYDGSTTPTYYRLDFATDEKDTDKRTYLPILRNHRYLFNIVSVKGPGFNSPEAALQSEPSGTIEYEVIVWDESIHEMHVQGKYYFGLDNREITLKAKSITEETDNFKVIKYQTNYPISDADKITFVWESQENATDPSVSPHFTAEWTTKGDKGEIKITPNNTNETNAVLRDVLHVKLGTFTIKVIVNQEYINFKYTLNCETVEVFGTYRPGHDLDPNKHYIILDITAEDATINGAEYIIETDTVNGIWFRTTGIFDVSTNNQTLQVTLKGYGELDKDIKIEPFTVTIRSNSSSGSYCEATIHPIIPTLRVVTIANEVEYAYDIGKDWKWRYKVNVGEQQWNIDDPRGTKAVLKDVRNFGPYDYSIVKIDSLSFFRMGHEFSSMQEKTVKWLQDGYEIKDEDGETRKYLADILYVGHDGLYGMSEQCAKVIKNYMKKGGVVIMFNEGGEANATGTDQPYGRGPIRFFRELFSDPSITVKTSKSKVVPFVGNEEVYKANSTNEEWNAFMYKLQADPVLNGPFGDVRNKQWGEDASWMVAVTKDAFPKTTINGKTEISDDISIYSYIADLTSTPYDTSKDYVSAFKYETDVNAQDLVSIVFFGDGGFMSNPYKETQVTMTGQSPFMYDKNYFPIPKKYAGGKYVYNSQTFCNIMAWAIERSAELFPKREAAMGRK